MEVVRGLRIGDGSVTPQKIYLATGLDTICYVTLPNGVLLTSVTGIIDYNWTGKDGAILMVVPKINDGVYMETARVYGTLRYNGYEGVLVSNSSITKIIANNTPLIRLNYTNIETVSFNKATDVSADYGALSAFSIGNFLLNAIKYNRTFPGNFVATNGTNATTTEINSYLVSQGTTLSAVLTQLATWAITLNA